MADIRITPGSSIMSFTSSLNYKETIIQDASGSLVLQGSGSLNRTNLFAIDGNNGRLFSVDDDLSDSLFSVNTIAGLPVIEAFANNIVVLGQYGANVLVVTGSRVGIGTASPTEKLHVSGGNIIVNSSSAIGWGDRTAQIVGVTGASGFLRFDANNAECMRINSAGNVGIGTTGPSQKLEVSGIALATTDMRAPIFYDSDNTAYYVNAASTSNLNLITLPNIEIINGASYNENIRMHPGSNDFSSLVLGAVAGTSGTGTGQWTLVRYPTTTYSNKFTIRHNSTDYMEMTTSGATTFVTDVRSPIFYDSDNTGYYVNPASTSNLVGLTVANTITGNITGNAATVGSITPVQFFNNMGDVHGTRSSFDASTPSYDFGFRYVQGSTNGPATGGGAQFYSWYIGLGSQYPGTGAGSYGMYVAIPRTPTTPYMSVRYNEANSLGSWLKIAAGYADSAGAVDFANLTNKGSGTGTYTTSGDFRAPIFYDSNNTGYYVDPAGSSSLNTVNTGNIYASGWFRNNNSNEGLYNQTSTQHLSSNTNGYWDMSSTTGVSAIRFYTGGHVTSLRGYVYADAGNLIGFLNPSGNWSLKVDSSGNATATADVIAYSDARVKENIKTIDNALEKVLTLRGVSYNRIDIEDKSEKIGVIAQEVKEVIPQVVHEQEDGTLGVAYGNFAGLFIEAFKEQQQQINELKELVNKLINK